MNTTAGLGAARPDPLTELARAVKGLEFDGVHVLEVRAEYDTGTLDDPIVRLHVTLTSPAEGQDTWPVESVRDIERTARRRAVDLEIPEFVYVSTYDEASDNEDEYDESDPDFVRRLAEGGQP